MVEYVMGFFAMLVCASIALLLILLWLEAVVMVCCDWYFAIKERIELKRYVEDTK